MGERTKQTLIITIGVVLLAGGYLVRELYEERKPVYEIPCKDGSTGLAVNPEAFLLKYSGRSVVVTTEWKDLKAKLGIEDTVLQEASEAAELLDLRLRDVAIHQAPLACDPHGREMYLNLERYRTGDFQKLLELAKELKKIGSGGAGDRARAESVVAQSAKVSRAAEKGLAAGEPKP